MLHFNSKSISIITISAQCSLYISFLRGLFVDLTAVVQNLAVSCVYPTQTFQKVFIRGTSEICDEIIF